MDKITIDEANVESTLNNVKVDTTLPDTQVITKESITAEVEPDNYVIASQGYSSGVPGWVSSKIFEIIQDSIGSGNSLADALEQIRTDLLDQIQLGVNQVISEVENEYVSQSSLATTLASELGASRAAVLNDIQTYADETQAVANEVNALKASFGNDISPDAINAFIGNIALIKATSKEAFASTIDTLTASYNDLSVQITSTEAAVAGQFTEWDGVSTPKVGMYKIEDGSYWNYVGGTLGENSDGWLRTDRGALDAGRNGKLYNATNYNPPIDPKINDVWVITDRWYNEPYNPANKKILTSLSTYTDADGSKHKLKQAIKVYDGTNWVLQDYDSKEVKQLSWAGTASKLLYSPYGGITGWEFADGSASSSEFKIHAKKFYISDGQGAKAKVPFSIDTSTGINRIKFDGIVDFTHTINSEAYKNSNVSTINLLTYGSPASAGYSGWTSSNVTFTFGLDKYEFAILQRERDNYANSDEIGTPEYIPLLPGETIAISGWVNTQYTTHEVGIGYRDVVGGTEVGHWNWVVVANAGQDWQYFEITLTQEDGYDAIRPFTIINSYDTFGEVYWTGLVYHRITADAIGAADKDLNNVTSIDGGKIKTGTIQQNGYIAGNPHYNSKWDLMTGEFVTHNADGSFILDSTTGGTIDNPNIKGGYIVGSRISSADHVWYGDISNTPPVGFGLYADSSAYAAHGYNIVGGKIYGAFISGARTAVSQIVTIHDKTTYYSMTGSIGTNRLQPADRTLMFKTGIYTSDYGTTEDVFRVISPDNLQGTITFSQDLALVYALKDYVELFRVYSGYDNNYIKIQILIGNTVVGDSGFIHVDNDAEATEFTMFGMTFKFGSPSHQVQGWYIKRTSTFSMPSNVTAQGELIFKAVCEFGNATPTNQSSQFTWEVTNLQLVNTVDSSHNT